MILPQFELKYSHVLLHFSALTTAPTGAPISQLRPSSTQLHRFPCRASSAPHRPPSPSSPVPSHPHTPCFSRPRSSPACCSLCLLLLTPHITLAISATGRSAAKTRPTIQRTRSSARALAEVHPAEKRRVYSPGQPAQSKTRVWMVAGVHADLKARPGLKLV